MEDNDAFTLTYHEWARCHKSPLFIVIVDLTQVYDSMNQPKLFDALIVEIVVPISLITALVYLHIAV